MWVRAYLYWLQVSLDRSHFRPLQRAVPTAPVAYRPSTRRGNSLCRRLSRLPGLCKRPP